MNATDSADESLPIGM